MKVKTRFDIGQKVYYITSDGEIASFVVDQIRFSRIRENLADPKSIRVDYCLRGTSWESDRLYGTLDEAKTALITKIINMVE